MHGDRPEEISQAQDPTQQSMEDKVLRVLTGRIEDLPGQNETRSGLPCPANSAHLPYCIADTAIREQPSLQVSLHL